MRGERLRVAGVEAVCVQVVEAVRGHDRARDALVHVGNLDVVVAGFSEQSGDQRTDLAGPEDEDLVHLGTPGLVAGPAARLRREPASGVV